MTDLKKILVQKETLILEALRVLDSTGLQIVVVIDINGFLLGTITDGDIRRGILDGCSLDDPVTSIMNREPITAKDNTKKEHILALMKKKRLHQIPVLDNDGRVVEIQIVDDLIRGKEKNNWVMLMAGGMGTRLRPLTDDCPKPLLRIGGKPVLELILDKLIEAGFNKYYISVNYQAQKIKEYFEDGSRWAATIQYLEENKKLGTAGCLGLIPVRPTEPVLVMNGDLLTSVNYEMLLDFHASYHSMATMCVREYKVEMPFGVVKVDRHRFTSIIEKPVENFFVNAGIYVLDPVVFEYVEEDSFLDMPELFERIRDNGLATTVFPLHEDWLDIGRLEDLEKANREIRGD